MHIFKVSKILFILKILVYLTQGDRCAVDYPWTYEGPGICFFVTSLTKTWNDAYNYCNAIDKGIKLPIVKNISSVGYLYKTLASLGKGNEDVWLGAFKSGANFKWHDGTELPSNDQMWGTGEPSGNGICVAMWDQMQLIDGTLLPSFDDTKCGEKKLTVCACKKVSDAKNPVSSVDKLFKDSPSLGPYKNEYEKKISSGGNPVVELENVALKAATDLLNSNSSDSVETVQTDVMKMQISKYRIATFKGQVFTSLKDNASFELPASAIQVTNNSADYAATIGIAYSEVAKPNDLLNPASLPNSSAVWMLDSDVITFSVIHDQLNLTYPVILKFISKRQETQEKNTCAFWNTTLNAWSQEGCFKMSNGSNVTICHCYHLTTFASLMQVTTENNLSTSDEFVINVITYICFGASYVGLFLTIMFILISKSFTKPNSFIHFNLCVAILLAQSTFLSGISSTKNKAICKFVAALLHFLYLSVACWMLVEGLFLFRMTRRVFNTNRNVLGYCLIGWGAPVFLVAIMFSFLHKSYGYEAACWLNKETGVIWAFAGPMILILSFNAIVLVIAIRAALNIRMNKSKSEREKIGVGIKAVAILLPLLGVTWIFGVLAIGPAARPMQIIFAICNGLQGFFIFLFHCVRNPELKHPRVTRQTYYSGSGKIKIGPSNESIGPAVVGSSKKA